MTRQHMLSLVGYAASLAFGALAIVACDPEFPDVDEDTPDGYEDPRATACIRDAGQDGSSAGDPCPMNVAG